jgi:hypothetical protein
VRKQAPRKKYHEFTRVGKEELEVEGDSWRKLTIAVS